MKYKYIGHGKTLTGTKEGVELVENGDIIEFSKEDLKFINLKNFEKVVNKKNKDMESDD